MLSHKLDSLQHSLGLVDVAPNAHIVDGDVLQDALRVDQVGPTEGHSIILRQAPVLCCNLLQEA